MFWVKLIIFLMISVVSQVKCHPRETSRLGRPSNTGDSVPNKNSGWTILKDDQGKTYKYWVGKHESTASSTGDEGGDMTAIIQEEDLIAVQGTRNRRPREPVLTILQKPRNSRVITTSERAKNVANNAENQMTREDSSENCTTDEPSKNNEETSVTPLLSSASTRGMSTGGRTTLKKEKFTELVSSSTTRSTPKVSDSTTNTYIVENHHVKPYKTYAVDEKEPLLALGPDNSVSALNLNECDTQNSDVDVGPTTMTTIGENENEINFGNKPNDLNRSCDTRDGLVLFVENNIKLKLVVDSKRVLEKQSIERNDHKDLPVTNDNENPADTECTETDKKPVDGFMSLPQIKKRTHETW